MRGTLGDGRRGGPVACGVPGNERRRSRLLLCSWGPRSGLATVTASPRLGPDSDSPSSPGKKLDRSRSWRGCAVPEPGWPGKLGQRRAEPIGIAGQPAAQELQQPGELGRVTAFPGALSGGTVLFGWRQRGRWQQDMAGNAFLEVNQQRLLPDGQAVAFGATWRAVQCAVPASPAE